MKIYSDVDLTSNGGMVLDFEIFNTVLKMTSLDEVKDYFKGLCKKLYEYISKSRQDDWSILVEKACIFIKDNYNNTGLNVQMVCDYLHLSSSYFSKIFKNGVGETFVEFLTGIRIEKSKDLLRNTTLKSYEIANMVGYEDPHYFSHIFKKKTGCTPKEYRGK